jgi:pimeloyl-ACP methyl ester carboxylesterase
MPRARPDQPARPRRPAPFRRYARRFADGAGSEARLSDTALPPLDLDSGLWPGETVEIDGQELFVRHTPPTREGLEPALFVHGLGGASTNWTDLAGQLRGAVDATAIDLPGFGRSGPALNRDYRQNAHCRSVIRYLEDSGRGPVHLIGNSMGGAISALVASSRPDLVRTLTLISPAVPDIRLRLYPVRYNPRMALLVLPGLAEPALRRGSAKLGAEQVVRGTISLCFADARRFPPQRFAESVEEAKERAQMPWAAQAMVRSGRGLAAVGARGGPGFWSALQRIAAPTLVLWGEADRLVAPDLAPYVTSAVPAARLLVLPDIGHVAMMEDPVTTARAVLGLLEDTTEQPTAAGPLSGGVAGA